MHRSGLLALVAALCITTPALAQANLEITKSAPAGVEPGQTFPFGITVTNLGPDPATNVVVTDLLPDSVDLQSVNVTQGACVGDPNVVCNLGGIAANASATITLNVLLVATSGTVVNSASVTATEPDPVPANNTDDAEVVVIGDVNLTIDKSGPALVIPHEPFPYQITVTNAGPAIAVFVEVSDVLPAGLELISAEPSQGTCAGDPNITCSLGSIDPGEEATIALSVRTTQSGGTIENTATVDAWNNDVNPADNSDTSVTAVELATAVPTLSEWMLLLFAGGLGLAALFALRR